MRRQGGGFDAAYNVQATVDDLRQVIVAPGITNNPSDNAQLIEQVDEGIKNTGEKPGEVSADSECQGGPNLKALEERNIDAYIPQGNNHEREENATAWVKYKVSKFKYHADKDIYVCPEGRELVFRRLRRVNQATGSYHAMSAWHGTERIYRGKSCQDCKASAMCTRNPRKGRTLKRSELFPLIEKVRKKLSSDEGRRTYGKRKGIVEPVFGVIKQVMKFRQFLLRGLEKARAEWELVCLAYNIRKISVARANK